MKKNILTFAALLICLLVQFGTNLAQTTKPVEPKKFDINDLYALASETNVAEVAELVELKENLKKYPSAGDANCKYILGVKKFQRSNDEVFDTLVGFQRLGQTVTGQSLPPEENIKRWVIGRANDRIAMNKIIGIYSCLPPEQVKEETRNRIIESLKKLGNLTAYIEEAKKVRALTAASPKEDICAGFSAMKKESDKIDPDLEEFATLYVAEGEANPAARSVDFSEPAILERAEKLLNIRAKLFLPLKEDTKTNLTRYGCK